MKKLHDYYRELEKECSRCKTKFNVWMSESNFDSDQEENVKSHFLQYCPPCRVVEKSDKANKE